MAGWVDFGYSVIYSFKYKQKGSMQAIQKKPKKTAQRSMVLPPELNERLTNACRVVKLPVNHVLNQLIEQWVDELENQILDEAGKE
jgi:predicted DNA-binding protein